MSSVDSGLATTLKAHADLAIAAATNKAPVHTILPGFPAHILHIWNYREGKLEQMVAPPVVRDYEAATVASLADLINQFIDNPALNQTPPGTPTDAVSAAEVKNRLVFVWIQDGNVIVTLDETGDRRENITLRLSRSASFNALTFLAGQWVGQREFVEALRFGINAQYSPSSVIDIVRALRWSQNEQGESTVQTGRASFGRRVEAAIAGVDETDLRSIEDLTVTLPVYSNLFDEEIISSSPIMSTFRCAVDVHPTEQKIILKIKAGEVERNLRDLDVRVRDMLVGQLTATDRVKIFFGSPDAN